MSDKTYVLPIHIQELIVPSVFNTLENKNIDRFDMTEISKGQLIEIVTGAYFLGIQDGRKK